MGVSQSRRQGSQSRRDANKFNRLKDVLSSDIMPRKNGSVWPNPIEISEGLETLCMLEPRKAHQLTRMVQTFGIAHRDGRNVYETAVLREHAQKNCSVTLDVGMLASGPGLFWPGLSKEAWLSDEWVSRCALPAIEPIESDLLDIMRAEITNCPFVETVKHKHAKSRYNLDGGKHAYNEGDPENQLADESEPISNVTAICDHLEKEQEAEQAKVQGSSSNLGTSSSVWSTIWFRSSLDPTFTFPKNRRFCPSIAKFIDSIPSKCGDAFVSILQPGSHIKIHQGPTNAKLTAHMGLSGVDQDVKIKAGSEVREWIEGKWIVFNDSMPHEVWHSGTEPRCVLIVDVWNTEITNAERWALQGCQKLAAHYENQAFCGNTACGCGWLQRCQAGARARSNYL